MPSQVATYNDDDLIGTSATTADANFDQTHPLYRAAASDTAGSREGANLALRRGAQIQRYSSGRGGRRVRLLAHRARRRDRVRGRAEQRRDREDAVDPDLLRRHRLQRRLAPRRPGLTTNGSGELTITVPPLSASCYKADAPLAANATAADRHHQHARPRARSWSAGSRSAPRLGRRSSPRSRSRSRSATRDIEVIGTDNNAPYRVFYETAGLAEGTAADVQGRRSRRLRQHGLAIRHGRRRRRRTATGSVAARPTTPSSTTCARRPTTTAGASTSGATSTRPVDVDSPVPLAGEDDYGPFAWVKLLPNAIKRRLHPPQGRREGHARPDRFFDPIAEPADLAQAGRR